MGYDVVDKNSKEKWDGIIDDHSSVHFYNEE